MREYGKRNIERLNKYVREEMADRRGDKHDRLNLAKNAMLDKLVLAYLYWVV